MWKILSHTIVIGLFASGTATAQSIQPDVSNGTPVIVPSTSSFYNQQGFNLPTAPRTSGQDIVRGSGGISCQSAVSSNGPTFDMGVIGTTDIYSRNSTALYGRLTVQLGKKPKRVDCSHLYGLEIERLKMELQLMRAGVMGAGRLNQQQNLESLVAAAEILDAESAVQSDPPPQIYLPSNPAAPQTPPSYAPYPTAPRQYVRCRYSPCPIKSAQMRPAPNVRPTFVPATHYQSSRQGPVRKPFR